MAVKNGALPASLLTQTSAGKYLQKSAAASYERLNREFTKHFGKRLSITDGYRSLSRQHELFNSMGYPAAARPGESNHGLGIAADFGAGVAVYGSAEHKWMDTVGRRHGWIPLWQSLGKRRNTFEPWHWVHVPSKDRYPWRRVKYTSKWDAPTIYAVARALGRPVYVPVSHDSTAAFWRAIQRRINWHERGRTKGFVPLKIDGDPGPKTIRALQVYLRRVLKFWRPRVDGQFGPKTVKAFQRALNARRF